jgi:hypothetical protein
MIGRRIPLSVVALLATVASVAAQTGRTGTPPAPAGTENVALAPIECFWRTSAPAVHVGELFDVVLTCDVIETASTTVVPDQTRLDPDVLQLQPFEVVQGTPAQDIRTLTRRYFQYTYRVRYIGEEIGRDVVLPAVTLTYRVQSRVEAGAAAVEGRERQYVLPARPVRILSLLPGVAQDIRETSPATFDTIASRRFTARVLRIVSMALFVVAGIFALWALVRAIRGRRTHQHVTVRLASDAAILGGAARELAAVRRLRTSEGWSDSLAARALAALRVAANYEVGRVVTQTPAAAGMVATAGQFRVSGLWPRGPVLLSGAATTAHLAKERVRAETAGRARQAARLGDLEAALSRFAVAAYGRDHATPDDGALDEALENGTRAVAVLRREHGWLMSRLRALMRSAGEIRSRAWAR